MVRIKITDRAALMRAYPPDQFADDAAENSAATSQAVARVGVLRASDANGVFALERRRQKGETASAAFLAPYRRTSR